MSQPRMGTINGVFQEITWAPISHDGPICRARVTPWKTGYGVVETHCRFEALPGKHLCRGHGAARAMFRKLLKLAKARGIEIVED